MAIPITTAGKAEAQPAANPRRDAIKAIRAKMRNPDVTDEDFEDALEALAELGPSKQD